MAIMLITHDLGVVAENADVVYAMYASRVVECATVEDLFDKPLHPYTEGLFRSIPKLHAYNERLDTIPGTVPNPARFPSGCKFHPRCHRTRELAAQAPEAETVEIVSAGERFRVLKRCQNDEPAAREIERRHWAACHQRPGYDGAPLSLPVIYSKRAVVPTVVEPIGVPVVSQEVIS
jgi:oligopeptide/dipeptide ABC transporter ATP-binding protein